MVRVSTAIAMLAVLLLSVGAATAQTGSWGIPAATPWISDDWQLSGEARFFEDDNETWGVFVRGAIGPDAEGTVGYFDWDVTGEDPINGAVRRSDMSAVIVDLKFLLSDGSPRVALRVGGDLKVGSATGTNTATGASAFLDGPVPTVSLPIEFGNPDGLLWILEPKVIWFGTRMPTTTGQPIEGFGTTIMVGGAVRYPVGGDMTLMADAAYPVNDSNSIDDVTNAVTEELAWSAGVEADLGSGWDVGVFATTAAGPTPATSAIAAPDQSIGAGVRVGKTW